MPASSAQAKATICPEKQELARALAEAVRDVMALQDRQLAALVAGQEGLDRFELAITRARQKRERAKKLYQLHLVAHGC